MTTRAMAEGRAAEREPRASVLAARTFDDLPLLLDVGQTAELTGVSHRTVRRWIAAGLLGVHRMPGTTRIRIRRDELLEKLGLPEAAKDGAA